MATTSDWGASREPFPRHLLYDARTIAKSCSRVSASGPLL